MHADNSTAPPKTSATRSISSTSTCRCRTSGSRSCSTRSGLGLTRDPYLMVSDTNMWINVGRSQFHLPTGKAQVVRGHTGLVIPGREALLDRLAAVRRSSRAPSSASANTTTTSRRPVRGAIGCAATSRTPRASAASRSAFHMSSSTCRSAPRRRSRQFYPAVFGTPAQVQNGDGTVARTLMGKDQYLQFRETDAPQPDFDGHHVQMYIANFSGPYGKLKERNLISVEDNQYQYRFQDIVDLDSGKRAVHGRARGAQRHASDVSAPAGQPQSGDHQPELRQRLRSSLLGDGTGANTNDAGECGRVGASAGREMFDGPHAPIPLVEAPRSDGTVQSIASWSSRFRCRFRSPHRERRVVGPAERHAGGHGLHRFEIAPCRRACCCAYRRTTPAPRPAP